MQKLLLAIQVFALTGISVVCRAQYTGGTADGGSSGMFTAAACSAPPNANIYFGGLSDGANSASLIASVCAAPANANVYFGGIEDGHSSGILAASVWPVPQNSNIYFGGIADGHSSDSLHVSSCPVPQNTNIYFGGVEDGFSMDSLRAAFCPIPQNTNVFFGGIEDGFSFGKLAVSVCTPPANANIYFGGIEDGFSSHFYQNMVNPCILTLRVFTLTGSCADQSIALKWNTAGEENHDLFSIEYSPDGSNWEGIGMVPGGGALQATQTYSFTDPVQRSGSSYYRVKETDPDGQSSYSTIIVMESCTTAGPADRLTIYPNPSFGVFNLLFDGDRAKVSSIEVYNVLDEMIYRSGIFQSSIVLTGMATGTYFVHFIADGKTTIKKIVIRR